MSLNVNLGCGQSPINGWRNYDNSWSIRLAKLPLLVRIMGKLGFISKQQQKFVSFIRNADIRWADVTKQIPEKDGSVDLIYSCHMLEHLDKEDAIKFLKEARRILKSGGIIRIAVPNIKYHVENYLKDNDAENFINSTLLTRVRPKNIVAKLKYLVIGDRNHLCMYDGRSLCKLLLSVGFHKPKEMAPGTTIITGIVGGLDLKERLPESVFIEATNL
jgi:SAM-dependent methyltransferase